KLTTCVAPARCSAAMRLFADPCTQTKRIEAMGADPWRTSSMLELRERLGDRLELGAFHQRDLGHGLRPFERRGCADRAVPRVRSQGLLERRRERGFALC